MKCDSKSVHCLRRCVSICHRFCPFVHSGAQAKKGGLCTEQGLSYSEAKHLLLLHYCQCLVFYVLLKLEGGSVKDHPAVLRLVEIRAYLEKLRPLEARLQPQVDKLLRAVSVAARTTEGASSVEMSLPTSDRCVSPPSRRRRRGRESRSTPRRACAQDWRWERSVPAAKVASGVHGRRDDKKEAKEQTAEEGSC